MQIQEFFFGFASYHFFSTNLSSVYMDKIFTMIILYVFRLKDVISRVIQEDYNLTIVLITIILLFEYAQGFYPPEDKIAYKI